VTPDPLTKPACLVYAVHDEGSDDSQFFTLAIPGEITDALGRLHHDLDLEGLDLDPRTGELCASAGDDGDLPGHLFLVDADSGDVRDIGPTGFEAVEALSFRPSEGTLWGWAEDWGLIRIDPSSGVAEMVFESAKGIEGLAWDNQGRRLYAASGRTLWVYDPAEGHFQKLAMNLPGTTEALEMRPDGFLAGGIHNADRISIFTYDVQSLLPLPEKGFATPYNDVEGIAWPEACRP